MGKLDWGKKKNKAIETNPLQPVIPFLTKQVFQVIPDHNYLEKNGAGRIRLYCKATVIKMVLYQYKNRNIDQ